MNSPTSNLGRGFEALVRDIERWKGRTSDASIGPGTIHDPLLSKFTATARKVLGNQSSHADIRYQRYHDYHHRSLQDGIAGMWQF
jgi:hypothetical protein